jgi:outer membrane immunogenic protein
VKRLLVIVSSIGLALASGSALAADMPVKAPLAPAPIYSWTGWYVGGNVGWAGERDPGTSNFTDTSPGLFPSATSNPQSNSPSASSAIGGVQAGYNWQITPRYVLGVEGDWDWLRASYGFCRQTSFDSIACLDAPPNGAGFESIASQANWIATARARLGVTWDRFMFYGTGGVAFGDIKTTESLSCLDEGCGDISTLKLAASSTFDQTKVGWTAGLGVEGFLDPSWSIKAEWLHVDLGNLNETFPTVGNAGGTESVVWSRDARFDTVRVGLNYHFNGPLLPSH